MIRSKTELCLLCQSNQADKTGSHIIPKFMTKSMVQEGRSKKAYLMSSHSMYKPIIGFQDTPKQDHILCSVCEKYFGVIETYFANQIHKTIRDVRHDHIYEVSEVSNKYIVKTQIKANSLMIFLLIYSIVWRCHISDHDLFKNFKLPRDEAIRIQEQLSTCRTLKQNELLEQLKTIEDSFDLFPYTISTPKIHKNVSKNFLLANSTSHNPIRIWAAEYFICMYTQPLTDLDTLHGCNSKVQPSALILVDELDWDDMLNQVIAELVIASNSQLKNIGQSYYGLK